MRTQYIVASVATLVVLVAWGVTAVANWHFSSTLGDSTPFSFLSFKISTSQIYEYASLSIDVMKALGLFAVAIAIYARCYPAAALALVIWIGCMLWALNASMGFVSHTYSKTMETRGAASESWTQTKGEIDRLSQRMSWIPQHRPGGAVAADIEAQKVNALYARSKSCSDATLLDSRDFCRDFHGLNREIANAQESRRMETDISAAREKLATLTKTEAADPWAAMAAKLYGVSTDEASLGRATFIALLLEAIASFGLYIFWHPLSVLRRQDKIAAAAVQASTLAKAGTRELPDGVSDLDDYRKKPVADAPEPVAADVVAHAPQEDAAHIRAWMRARTLRADPFLEPAVSGKKAYADYARYCQGIDVTPVRQSAYGTLVRREGVIGDKGKDGVKYRGFQLQEADHDPRMKAKAA